MGWPALMPAGVLPGVGQPSEGGTPAERAAAAAPAHPVRRNGRRRRHLLRRAALLAAGRRAQGLQAQLLQSIMNTPAGPESSA